MGVTLKIRKTGNSLSTIWPKELLAHLNAKAGDQLYVVPTKDGFSVRRYDPEFQKSMEIVEKISDQYKNAYRELAKR